MKDRVLIVEDDEFIRDPLKELLEAEGYDVSSASNGEEGLKYLRENEKPTMILLDLMMPVKDGFQFREEQLADPNSAHLPVVVMSADGNVDAKSKKLSATAYLKKPVDIYEVLNTVARICSGESQKVSGT